jgi:hypothetical protein
VGGGGGGRGGGGGGGSKSALRIEARAPRVPPASSLKPGDAAAGIATAAPSVDAGSRVGGDARDMCDVHRDQRARIRRAMALG